MKIAALIMAPMLLVGCDSGGWSAKEEELYNEGYDQGQYDVCAEIASMAPRIKDKLRHCRGF